MKKYEVVLPISLEDGTVHPIGSVIELDLETAKAYAHALRAVETEGK